VEFLQNFLGSIGVLRNDSLFEGFLKALEDSEQFELLKLTNKNARLMTRVVTADTKINYRQDFVYMITIQLLKVLMKHYKSQCYLEISFINE